MSRATIYLIKMLARFFNFIFEQESGAMGDLSSDLSCTGCHAIFTNCLLYHSVPVLLSG